MNGGRIITSNVGSLPIGEQTTIPNQGINVAEWNGGDVAFDCNSSGRCCKIKSGVEFILLFNE